MKKPNGKRDGQSKRQIEREAGRKRERQANRKRGIKTVKQIERETNIKIESDRK